LLGGGGLSLQGGVVLVRASRFSLSSLFPPVASLLPASFELSLAPAAMKTHHYVEFVKSSPANHLCDARGRAARRVAGGGVLPAAPPPRFSGTRRAAPRCTRFEGASRVAGGGGVCVTPACEGPACETAACQTAPPLTKHRKLCLWSPSSRGSHPCEGEGGEI
jgi:hypothetical protein